MKVVISDWGWTLSKKAYKRIAELMGVECHFYEYNLTERKYYELSYEEVDEMYDVYVSSVPNQEDFTKLMDPFFDPSSEESTSGYSYRPIISDFRGLQDCKERSNPILVQVAEELGQELMLYEHCDPRIVEIPDDVEWYIDSDEGYEWVAEKHRKWR